ncbi:ArsR/SmtB family transcription factor [Lederbergia citri]|uniref:Helix-turn-helix domain-containing protein n=1 Tax=Lederbergia citri TaxID=2833580 RepID=A0A942YFZ2_9BACI|nr:ArsR family transcriptional regulator [Lederbergia citri]MBS4195573.1 helix-turn-helix domain-containing protein [Lederbergia citri]
MLELTIDEPEALIKVSHALSSKVRIDILKLLNVRKMNINEIAEKLDLSVSTIASNIKVLENADIIATEIQPASRGTMKICSRNFEDVYMNLNLFMGKNDPKNYYQIDMPIGHYVNCDISPTCGLIGKTGIIKPADEPSIFFLPERMSAQLLWFRRGFVDYRFPMLLPPKAVIQSLQFSFELCSEAPRYDHDWPSDITVWINGVEIYTWTCPGDFGDRKGKLNPAWYPINHTQYGLLKTWKVDNSASYLDDVKVSSVNILDLKLGANKHVDLRIGIKQNAANVGGINLFGQELGDHAQDIVMRVIYELDE